MGVCSKQILTQPPGIATVLAVAQPIGSGLSPSPTAGGKSSYESYGDLSSSTSPTQVTTSYTYDNNGNRPGTSFIAANNQVVTTSTQYNANDEETTSYNEFGEETLTNYDAKGRVTSTTDVVNNVDNTTTTIYDNRDEVIQTTSPDGTITDSVYDAEGRVIYTDDPHISGQSDVHGTHTIYDSDGRVTETDRLDNVVISVNPGVSSQLQSAGAVLSTTSSKYNDLGQVTSTTAAAGLVTDYTYDKDGRQTSQTQILPNSGPQITTSTTYDAAGRAVDTTDGLGHVTQSVYDGDGKLLKTIFADGTYLQYGYDANGRKISETDQLGNTTQYEYDTQGRLTAVKLPAVVDPNTGQTVNPTSVYGYDNYGNLTSILDANNHTTSFTYDPFGHETSRTLPQGQGDTAPPTETMTYDNYGRLSTHTDFAGNETVYQYDTLGRLDETDYYQAGHNPSTDPPDEKVTTQYDSLGQVLQVTDSAYGTLTFHYDLDNRLSQEITPEGEIDYSYDAATGEHISTTTVHNGTVSSGIDYSYNALGQLTTVHLVTQNAENLVSLGTDQTQKYTYDADGNVTHTELDQGTSVISTSDYTYDKLNRLQSLVQYDSAGTQLARYSYQRYANGNISEVDESVLQPDNTTTQTNTITYQYDADNRLTEEKLISSDSSLTQTTDYTLDLVGNRTKEVITKSGQTETITYQYDARDRLLSQSDSANGTTTFGYDVNGNLTGQTNPDNGTVTYNFDLRGRMVQATAKTSAGGVLYVESLTYNSDGVRTSSTLTQNGTTTTSRYLIDGHNPTGFIQELEVLNSSGALVTSYLYGLLGAISQTQSGQTNYYLLDGHSGVRQLLTTAGVVANAYLYSAYGNLLSSAGSVSNPLLYRGQWFDATLGQYYLRARFYDPATGRFTAMDPLLGKPNTRIIMPGYAYTLNDPINDSDPSGLVSSALLRMLLAFMKNPKVKRLSIAGFAYAAAKMLIGTRATYVMGRAYIVETGANPDHVLINKQIARKGEVPDDLWIEGLEQQPDILDQDRSTVYEIKPEGDLQEAREQLDRYRDPITLAYGRDFQRGTWMPERPYYTITPNDWFPIPTPLRIEAWLEEPGVILYRSLGSEDLIMEAYLATEIASAFVRLGVSLRNTAESGRMEGGFGVAMLNAMLGLL